MSLHVIDNVGNLVPEQQLTQYLTSIIAAGEKSPTSRGESEELLRSVGVNYHVVGVFGGQSSGKSTLLNHLFSTDFQTLDETVRRGQTTKGAFLARADASLEGFADDAAHEDSSGASSAQAEGARDANSSRVRGAAAANHAAGAPARKPPLLVFDFEGTDGLEHGEDQSFERHLSLFGLSVADTLIINMWAVDVGRFNAANLSLLRTIFEVNLQLFSHDSYEKEEKPTLLIVLRDFTEDDPNPSLVTVRKSFDTIWDNITRPERFAHSMIDELFRLKYYVMPHYKLQRTEFNQSVCSFRHWFGDRSNPDYLFRHSAMFRGVPLEGLPAYLSSCWDAIRTSKDLDIPTQREMLAVHRCKDARDQELRIFSAFCRHYEERIGRGEMVLQLSDALDSEMGTRLTEYFKQTRLYNRDVVNEQGRELEKALVDATMRVVDRFSKAIATEVLSGLEVRVQGMIDDCVHKAQKSAQCIPFVTASSAAAGAVAAEEDSVTGEEESTTPSEGAERYVMDSGACQKVVVNFWKSLCNGANELLGELSVSPSQAHLFGRYTSLVAQDITARGNVVNMVTDSVFAKIQSRISSMADDASEVMHRAFEECLTHNADGTVRFFSTTKGLQKAAPSAQQVGLVIMGSLLYFRLRLTPANPDMDSDDEGAGSAGHKHSRSARRVERERKVILLRSSPDERRFMLDFSTLDAAPSYPLSVSVSAPRVGKVGSVEVEEVKQTSGEASMGVTFECVLLSMQSAQRAYELYRQRCDFTTQLQLRSIESGTQRLPAWVIPALFVLGWNEMWYVITSPILLTFVIVICAVFFKNFFVARWQAFEETGPASIIIPLKAFIAHCSQLFHQLMPQPEAVVQRTTTAAKNQTSATSHAYGNTHSAAPSSTRRADPNVDTMRQRNHARKED